MTTYLQLMRTGQRLLEAANVENAAFEATEMCLSVLNINKTQFLLNQNMSVSVDIEQEFISLINRRINGEPLQYIIGEWSFYDSVFKVGKGVLIPRPETERLVDICVSHIKKNAGKVVFDLCAGTGCIGISIAKKCPQTQVWLFELFDGALEYLQKNVKTDFNNRLHIIKCNVLESPPQGLPEPDVIVSNPPYIATAEIDFLQKEVTLEPKTALDGGENGLLFYKAIAENWAALLPPGGMIAFECGEDQNKDIAALFGFMKNICFYEDLFGVSRFVTALK